jgi:hypothetical protein
MIKKIRYLSPLWSHRKLSSTAIMGAGADETTHLNPTKENGNISATPYRTISKNSDREPIISGNDEENALLPNKAPSEERRVEVSTSVSTIVAVLILGQHTFFGYNACGTVD